MIKQQPVGYSSPNKTGKYAKLSVQATHVKHESSRIWGGFSEDNNTFSRKIKLPKKASCPIEYFSYVNLDFLNLSNKYPNLKNIFLVLENLKKINNLTKSSVKWVSICMVSNLNTSDVYLLLKFFCRNDDLKKCESFIDSILKDSSFSTL